ncbi:uncharacterized protein LOC108099147 [Drosophila ficusphila]|uniref:uncharacterized protein LOC108099147 n=1 Tax=Drosophila ficusphila TaxID=30025 RepID=UPI0007E83FAD|nr:uncharacterized protein LOC108099147 [Drosophila ficusphila]
MTSTQSESRASSQSKANRLSVCLQAALKNLWLLLENKFTIWKMVHICTLVALLCPVMLFAAPLENPNPKFQVEYISNDKVVGAANVYPNIVPITRPPLVTQTAPPPPPHSKKFAYNPKSQTWTLIASGDPLPNEDTLTWNQSNDKWLTR